MSLLSLFHNQGRGRPIGGVPFLPTDIEGLQFWVDGADSTTLYTDNAKTTPVSSDGDAVGAWEDKSGNGNDALQATTADKPVYKVGIKNGLDGIRFDGTSDNLDISPVILAGGARTVFIVISALRVGVYEYPISWGAVGVHAEYGTAVLTAEISISYNDHRYGIAGAFASTPAIYTYRNAINSELNDIWINATSQAVGTIAGAPAALNTGNAAGRVGSRLNDSGFYTGDIFEELVYNSALSTANVQKIIGYLNNKWAIY